MPIELALYLKLLYPTLTIPQRLAEACFNQIITFEYASKLLEEFEKSFQES